MSNMNVGDVKVSAFTKSDYVIPFKMLYTQDGKAKFWDLVEIHHSVSVILYNRARDCLVCVKQFRPGVYLNSIPKAKRTHEIDTNKYPVSLGMTIEFCSGIVDKNESLRKIVVDEIKEETGYIVDEASLHEVQSFRSAVGISGDITTMFYTEITDTQKLCPDREIHLCIVEVYHHHHLSSRVQKLMLTVFAERNISRETAQNFKSDCGGVDEEVIEVIELNMGEAKALLQHPSPTVPVEFLYGLSWFFTHIRKMEVL